MLPYRMNSARASQSSRLLSTTSARSRVHPENGHFISPLFSHSCTIKYRITPLESNSYENSQGGWGSPARYRPGVGRRVTSKIFGSFAPGFLSIPTFDFQLSTVDCSREFRVPNFEFRLGLDYRLSAVDSSTSQAQVCNPIRMNTYTNAALKTLWNEHLQKNWGERALFHRPPEFRTSSFGAVNCQLSTIVGSRAPCSPSHTSCRGNFWPSGGFDTMWRLWPGRTSN